MVAGGALISAPIIIHLINRMRFRRVRWAAMEFLLKAQKRNRRRLIIEQILLLALRCLLILIAGFLVARFLGWDAVGGNKQSSVHVIILDDSLSMMDRFKDEKTGADTTSFEKAQTAVGDLAHKALSAGGSQRFVFLTLSRCAQMRGDQVDVILDKPLNDENVKELNTKLRETEHQCTALHLRPGDAFKAAREVIGKAPEGKKFIHLVSDFRQRDWEGADKDEIKKDIDDLCSKGVMVHLVDVAHPYRGEARQTVPNHDNVGIVDFRPETRVAAASMPIKLFVTLYNFSSNTKNIQVKILVDGEERLEASQPIPNLRALGQTEHSFFLPTGLSKPGHSLITAEFSEEGGVGLVADNTRHAVIEVRDRVPILILDGSGAEGTRPGGDTFALKAAFDAAKEYKVEIGKMEDLTEGRLERYPSIFLVNVPQLPDKAVKNLDEYVRSGGSVAFFLGDKVRPDFYTKALYADGNGIFPAPIKSVVSTSANDPSKPLTDEEKLEQRFLEDQLKIFARNEKHDIVKEVFTPGVRSIFRFLIIDRYFQVPRIDWPPQHGGVEEILTLPNRKQVSAYSRRTQDLLNRLPIDQEKYEKFKPGLETHAKAVKNALTEKLYLLTKELDLLLNDPGSEKDKRPSMVEFWNQDTTVAALRAEFANLLEDVKYGDPLVVGKRHGRGRVVAFLTTAGSGGTATNPRWHDWAADSVVVPTFPVVMVELQRYLTGVSEELSRTVGTPLNFEFDEGRYKDRMNVRFDTLVPDGNKLKLERRQEGVLTAVSEKPLCFSFDASKTRLPGLYYFDFYQANPDAPPDTRLYAFNVDTLAEGDLRRTTRDELERANIPNPPPDRGKVVLVDATSTFPEVIKPNTDWSESPWIYLIFLIVLIVEQALAVHLSFHLRGSEAQVPGQTARPQAAAPAQAA
jgi:hypothetical protein